MWPVSRDVNSPQNDRPDLLEEADDPVPWEPAGALEPANSADADREPVNSA